VPGGGGEPTRPLVVACGLGPAGPEFLSEAVRSALGAAPAYLRTARHLAAAPFLAAGATALDACYEEADSFEEAYRAIVGVLVAAAARHGRVAYGVPGSPLVLERTVELLRSDGRVDLEVLPAASFLDLAWARLGIDPVRASVRLVDGEEFATRAAGERGPLLVAQLWSPALLSELKVSVEEEPDEPVTLLHHLGHPDEQLLEVEWAALDRSLTPDHLTCLYIPALAAPVAGELARAEEVVRVLRERCPWDAAQTHESLVRHLLEESYEAIEAIDQLASGAAEGATALEEELGDVLCQVLFHSRLAAEEGLFTLADVARTLADKLVGRHPHVFGDAAAPDADVVLSSWERSKLVEKGRSSVMEGIPAALPALLLAEKVEKKAATVGLTPAERQGEVDLVALAGRLAAGSADEEALGALLLGITARCAAAGLDGEAALRRAAGQLRGQVARAERAAAAEGEEFSSLPAAARRERFLAARRA